MKILEEEIERKAALDLSHVNDTGIDFEVQFDGNGQDYPMDGDIAIIHFKAYAGVGEDAVLFENTRKRKRKFRFKVGAGTVIEGLDMIITKVSA